ncbi:MAG: hypothetical protein HN846_00535 [Candidatus Pacebacteria bacterium]|jgi:hypothetical protein|nr:hypothetical protein [Candidatus Paceibacterota bacterium]MBT3512259.1 hypothetical protein [Candidatus Paceibacterota bacterium]MBT4004791.1 hypothetical protein [Candidatus Paceibacterota bacterium]MBT4358699.1 hypothetical protein [Candidatus Paceibacterota bacterium]MBT4680998.1 hypothetical protein [Candidatus Paceibacterota bacterium]
MKSWIKWLDKNILLLLSGFLIAFIPLFPKIPFFSPIETYIVRVRIEDFLILFTFIIWLVQLIRKKIKIKSFTTWAILAYLVAGLLSVISSLWIIKTVPLTGDHVLKTALHYFRYLEYFSLFFIVYSSISKPKDVKQLLTVTSLSLLGISIYGIGQKYYYWPVYSTMNREFSKGIRLYLTEHARVQSTFAGHYDLAAYLVIILPIILALAYSAKKRSLKIGLFLLQLLGCWLLIMSAARTSFAAYGLASSIVIILFGFRQNKIWPKISWIASRFASLWIIIFIMMASFGSDIYDRFLQVVESYPQLHSQYLIIEEKTLLVTDNLSSTLKPDSPLADKTPPENSISTADAAVIVASDERPSPERPRDVYQDIPDQIVVATTSAEGVTGTTIIEKPRVWSDNALKYGLSMAIRLDTLWPRAIQGFLRNPLFGSGYATLNKTSLTDFTIADSTDNNFLRTLGETGFLGFITFYGAVISGLAIAVKGIKSKKELLVALSVGYLAATIGLLFNALYIDVFAASKVALTFWAVTGIFLGYYEVSK